MSTRRRIVLIQLPIPQPGMEPARGNVPLAAGYLKMFARQKGLEEHFEIDVFPPTLSNSLSECGLVEAILEQEPWMVGFTCYLWNINRSLWVAERVKQREPGIRTIFGGPEITADNNWVLHSAGLDFAAIGEGEQTFSDLLLSLIDNDLPGAAINGLYVSPRALQTVAVSWNSAASKDDMPEPLTPGPSPRNTEARGDGLEQVSSQTDALALPILEKSTTGMLPMFRQPLPNLNAISSPYLEGILDAADEEMLLLETIRGCIFKCKFCYYPKSYDDLYFVSRDKIIANLQHAREHGAKEVVLLDPTLNQRKDFADFVRLLTECNPGRQFEYFGELRSEGITPEIAQLLAEANFTEVEIGLQSVDPLAQELMDRKNNMKAFERGVRAMRDAGIKVKVDLIIGLPGDTVASVRRGMQYLRDSNLYDLVQVFNLAILPGTAFRQEAEQLGLQFQPVPPYYVLKTPTLELGDFYQLMAEAQEIFETEFDPLPEPEIPEPEPIDREYRLTDICHTWRCDYDAADDWPFAVLPRPESRAQALTLWFQGNALFRHIPTIRHVIQTCLTDNPHSTLQIILEPREEAAQVTPELLDDLLRVCYQTTSYLDRFYSMAPGRRKGAKRLVLLLSWSTRDALGVEWIDSRGEYADIVWQDAEPNEAEMAEFEYVLG